MSENNEKIAKSGVHTWPAFICSVLLNPNIIKCYGNKFWQLIPKVWRYWWVENTRKYEPVYCDITIELPPSIIVDKSIERKDFDFDVSSQLLPNLANCCNKNMLPTVLCPWGCIEYIFSCGYISLDILFQRFLPKAIIDLITETKKRT